MQNTRPLIARAGHIMEVISMASASSITKPEVMAVLLVSTGVKSSISGSAKGVIIKMLMPAYMHTKPMAVKISPLTMFSRSRGQNRSKPSRRVWGEVYCPRAMRSIAARYPKPRGISARVRKTGRMV